MAASFSYFLAPATCLASQGYSVSAMVGATFQGEDDRTLGNFFFFKLSVLYWSILD